MIHLTEGTLEGYIGSSKPTFVDFYASWCQPCQRMMKILPNLENEFEGKVLFIKVDVDENRSLADTYYVKSIPTFFIFKDGKQVEKWDGIKTLLEMKKILERYI